MPRQFPQLRKQDIGLTFGRLTVIERLPLSHGREEAKAKCVCECGKTLVTSLHSLRRGATRSCGCLMRDQKRAAKLTHAGSVTPEYSVWKAIRARCHNPSHGSFERYGGRGISVCEEWRDSFAAFRDHIGPRPSAAHQIDRIDNSRGYEPGNVRWVTR